MNNTTAGNFSHPLIKCKHPPVQYEFMKAVMITDIIVGLPGSIYALWIFCFRMRLRKPHIIFLVNLVLADFLLLISVPFRIDAYSRDENWVFGSAMCRINLYMLAINRAASIAFMIVVALNRYIKVIHPHHCIARLNNNQAWCLVGLIWVAVNAIRIPLLTTDLLHIEGNKTVCRSFYSKQETPGAVTEHRVVYILEFFLSWPVLLFCSTRIICQLHKRGMNKQKRVQKAIRSIITISVVFTFCFMPGILTGLVALYFELFNECILFEKWATIFVTCFSLNYLNSALDPVIYFFSSSTFHNTVRSSLRLKKKRMRADNRH